MVLDAVPGSGGSKPADLTSLDGKLVYAATDSAGTELWSSDGTPGGTARIADLYPGPGSANPSQLTAVTGGTAGSAVYFTADDGTRHGVLYKTDGTPAGTAEVKFIDDGYDNYSRVTNLAACNGRLVFFADDGHDGDEPWASDGTAAGTVMLHDIAPTPNFSTPGPLYPVNTRVVFSVYGGPDPGAWTSDGTADGTHRYGNAAPISASGYVLGGDSAAPTTATLGNYIYYNGGGDLWQTNAFFFQLVATMPKPLPPHTTGYISDLTAYNGRLYFSGVGASGDELWSSDGASQQGTSLLVDLAPGTAADGRQNNGSPRDMTVVNGTLYFDSAHTLLYKSDGTAAGTVEVNPGTSYSDLFDLSDLNDSLDFAGAVGAGATPVLWKSDGTAGGTIPVPAAGLGSVVPGMRFAVFDDALYFDGYDDSGHPGLWKVDAATGTPSLVQSGVTAANFAASGNDLFFTDTGGGGNGGDLWAVNGAAAALLHAFPSASSLTDRNGTLYFAAPGGLWQSDGTPAGTRLSPESQALGGSKVVTSIANAGGNLYFVNDDGHHPAELWEIPAPPLAPSGFSASAPSGNEIDLAWSDNANNETGFRLQRTRQPDFRRG